MGRGLLRFILEMMAVDEDKSQPFDASSVSHGSGSIVVMSGPSGGCIRNEDTTESVLVWAFPKTDYLETKTRVGFLKNCDSVG